MNKGGAQTNGPKEYTHGQMDERLYTKPYIREITQKSGQSPF